MTSTPAPNEPERAGSACRVRSWYLGYLGILFFQPAFDPVTRPLAWAVVGVVPAVFIPMYIVGQRHGGATRVRITVATLVLGVLTTPINAGANVLFVYAGAFAGTFEPPARARRWLAASTVLLAILALVSPVPFPYRLISFGPSLVLIWIVGQSTMQEAEGGREAARLRIENARIGHLATANERERIARDLHDLLGHTLTAVVVRAQLVQRLVADNPARASAEAGSIETAARDALAAVRHTVSGYRAVCLDTEVEHARTALGAAGVELDVAALDGEMSAMVETALALALREAVTNVIRHAGARTCRVALVHEGGEVRLEVVDDGRGGGADGNGMRGMQERIGALGGRVDRRTDAGTTVTVAVPEEVAG